MSLELSITEKEHTWKFENQFLSATNFKSLRNTKESMEAKAL